MEGIPVVITGSTWSEPCASPLAHGDAGHRMKTTAPATLAEAACIVREPAS
jgi:hypothetical protein